MFVCICACTCICFLPGFTDQQSNIPVATNSLISPSIVLNPMEDELDTLHILKDPQFLRNQERNNSKCKESFSFILRGRGCVISTDACKLLWPLLPQPCLATWPRDPVTTWPKQVGVVQGAEQASCVLSHLPRLSKQSDLIWCWKATCINSWMNFLMPNWFQSVPCDLGDYELNFPNSQCSRS